MKTLIPRLAIKIAEKGKQIRDHEYEIEFALPPLFCVLIGGILSIIVFCISVQLVNELMK